MGAFGKFNAIINPSHKIEGLHYAIVENGQIIATNGHVLAVVPVDSWVDDLEGYSEGKAFDLKLLKTLSLEKYVKIKFTENTVQAFEKYDSDTPDFESFYSAVKIKNNTRNWQLINDKGEKFLKFFEFVDWQEAVPKNYEAEVSNLAVNPKLLNDLHSCFNTWNGAKLFFGISKPIKVVPVVEGVPNENFGWGVIMPIEFL